MADMVRGMFYVVICGEPPHPYRPYSSAATNHCRLAGGRLVETQDLNLSVPYQTYTYITTTQHTQTPHTDTHIYTNTTPHTHTHTHTHSLTCTHTNMADSTHTPC